MALWERPCGFTLISQLGLDFCGVEGVGADSGVQALRNLIASPTVTMVFAALSGISQPNSSSKAMTSSTVSRSSAPRSSMNAAESVTFPGSTPKCSTMIRLTLALTSSAFAISQPHSAKMARTPTQRARQFEPLIDGATAPEGDPLDAT